MLQTVPFADHRLHALVTMPLTSYAAARRTANLDVLRKVLQAAAASCPVAQLDEVFRQAGADPATGRATLAWMVKYGLLRVVRGEG